MAGHDVHGRRTVMSSTLAATAAAGNVARPAMTITHEHELQPGFRTASKTAKRIAAAVASPNAAAAPTLLIKIATRKQNSANPSSPGTMPRKSARTPAGPDCAAVNAHTTLKAI